jgi:hypothetical protein
MTAETKGRIAELLSETADAHHTFEQQELGGQRDEEWADWYAKRLLERGLGDLVGQEPSEAELGALLERATEEHEREGASEDWSQFAAERIANQLGEPA